MGAAEHDKAPRRDQNSSRHGPRQGDFLRPWGENTSLHLQRGHHTQSLSLLLHSLQRASTEDPPHKYTGVDRPLIHMGDIYFGANPVQDINSYHACKGLIIFAFARDDCDDLLHVQENKSNIYLSVPFFFLNE